MDRLRIILAEDHAWIAEQLHGLLAPEFDIVAIVADGHALLRAVEATLPDLIVADIMMPGLDGITATAMILARLPATRVVLVTAHDDPELAARGYAAGALGYVSKHRAGQQLVAAVRAAGRGERYPGAP